MHGYLKFTGHKTEVGSYTEMGTYLGDNGYTRTCKTYADAIIKKRNTR